MHEHQPETLKGITDQITRILSQGYANNDELFNQLDALQGKRDKKVENIGYVLLEHDTRIEDIEKQQARLEALKQKIIKNRDNLMNYCVMEMLRSGIQKVVGKFIELTVCKSPTSAEYAKTPEGKPDFDRIDPRFVEVEVTEKPKVQTAAAIRYYKNTGGKNGGKVAKGFRIIDNRHYLKIE